MFANITTLVDAQPIPVQHSKHMKLVKYTIAASVPENYTNKTGIALIGAYVAVRKAEWATTPAWATFTAAVSAMIALWSGPYRSALALETREERDSAIARILPKERKQFRAKLVDILLKGTAQKERKGDEYVDRDTLDLSSGAKDAMKKRGLPTDVKRAEATILSDVSRAMGRLGLACHTSSKGAHANTAQYVAMAAALLKTPQAARQAGIPVLPTDPAKAISILRAMATAISTGKVEGFTNYKAPAAE